MWGAGCILLLFASRIDAQLCTDAGIPMDKQNTWGQDCKQFKNKQDCSGFPDTAKKYCEKTCDLCSSSDSSSDSSSSDVSPLLFCYSVAMADECWKASWTLDFYDSEACFGDQMSSCWNDEATDHFIFNCRDFESCGACCDSSCSCDSESLLFSNPTPPLLTSSESYAGMQFTSQKPSDIETIQTACQDNDGLLYWFGETANPAIFCERRFKYGFTIFCVIFFSFLCCAGCLVGIIGESAVGFVGSVPPFVVLIIIAGVYFNGPCPRGTMGWGRVCYDCPTGRYGGGQPDLLESSPKERTCSECKAGFYSPIGRLPGCFSCTQGKYQDAAGRNQCKSCTAGGYTGNYTTSSTLGIVECLYCPLGTYAQSSMVTSCTKCPTGKSSPAKENTKYECVSCLPGYYQPTTGEASCQECEAGMYAAKPGQSNCVKCPKGYSSGDKKEGRASCSICIAGSYAANTGQKSCSLCGVGTANGNTGGTSSAVCESCAAGQFSSNQGVAVCSECGAGTISTSAGNNECESCASGKFVEQAQQSSCNDCVSCESNEARVQKCGGSSAGRCDQCPPHCQSCHSPDQCVGISKSECMNATRIYCRSNGCINAKYYHNLLCHSTCLPFALFKHEGNDDFNVTTGFTCRTRRAQTVVLTFDFGTAVAMNAGNEMLTSKLGKNDLATIVGNNIAVSDVGVGVSNVRVKVPDKTLSARRLVRLPRLLQTDDGTTTSEATLSYFVAVEPAKTDELKMLEAQLEAWTVASPVAILDAIATLAGAASVKGVFQDATVIHAGECPRTFKFDEETQICVPCTENCARCEEEVEVCQVCSGDAFTLSGTKCYTTCNPGHERNFVQLTDDESGYRCDLWDGVPLAVGLALFFVFVLALCILYKMNPTFKAFVDSCGEFINTCCGGCFNNIKAWADSKKAKSTLAQAEKDQAKAEKKRTKKLLQMANDEKTLLENDERKIIEHHVEQLKNQSKGGGENHANGKFNPAFNPKRALTFGNADDALDIEKFLGMSEQYIDKVKENGEQAMEKEVKFFQKDGRKPGDPENWFALGSSHPKHVALGLNCEQEVLDHWNYVVNKSIEAKKKEYPNGIRDHGRKTGMQLEDFMKMPEVVHSKLAREHVIALRLYTTVVYKYINDPLRNQKLYRTYQDQPDTPRHPLAAVVLFIQDGLVRLRKVAKPGNKDIKAVVLWRGMSNAAIGKEFLDHGGSEKAPMSTTTDLKIALKYAVKLDSDSVVFRIVASTKLKMGANLKWLSAFPQESEVLYPPLTYLEPDHVGKGKDRKAKQEKITIENNNGTTKTITIIQITPDINGSSGLGSNKNSPVVRSARKTIEGKQMEGKTRRNTSIERNQGLTQVLPEPARPMRTRSLPEQRKLSIPNIDDGLSRGLLPIALEGGRVGQTDKELPIATVELVSSGSPRPSPSKRLSELKQMLSDKNITQEQFDAKQAQILADL